MKKLIIISVISTPKPELGELTSIAYEINCSSDEEPIIRQTITCTQNPDIILDILSQKRTNKTDEELIELEKTLSPIKDKILQSDYIKVNFLPLEKCEESCETCLIHAFNQLEPEVVMSVKDLIAAGRFDLSSLKRVCLN